MATIELSMIVKNGAAGLERCLRSVSGIVDRIVIGDNGSADETLEIARAFRAEAVAMEWTEDFSAARNAVLSRARCDWILVLDADEMLAPPAVDALAALTRAGKTAAWNMRRLDYVTELDVRCHGNQALRNTTSLDEAKCYPAHFESVLTRLFRRDPRIRFEGYVHETVAYSVDRAGLLRSDCDLLIHHFGYVEDSPQVREAKSAYYHRLGLRKLTQGGGKDARAYLETGISFLDYSRNPTAAQKFLERSAELDPNNPLVWLYLGLCSTRLGRLEMAYTQLDRSRSIAPENSLVHCAMGDVYFQQQRYAEAAEAYHCASVLGDSSALTEAKLGASLVQSSHGVEGLDRVKTACAANPGSTELQRILATSAVSAGDIELACQTAQRCIAGASSVAFDFLLGASIYLQAAQPQQAKAVISAGLDRYPNDSALQQTLLTIAAKV